MKVMVAAVQNINETETTRVDQCKLMLILQPQRKHSDSVPSFSVHLLQLFPSQEYTTKTTLKHLKAGANTHVFFKMYIA